MNLNSNYVPLIIVCEFSFLFSSLSVCSSQPTSKKKILKNIHQANSNYPPTHRKPTNLILYRTLHVFVCMCVLYVKNGSINFLYVNNNNTINYTTNPSSNSNKIKLAATTKAASTYHNKRYTYSARWPPRNKRFSISFALPF